MTTVIGNAVNRISAAPARQQKKREGRRKVSRPFYALFDGLSQPKPPSAREGDHGVVVGVRATKDKHSLCGVCKN